MFNFFASTGPNPPYQLIRPRRLPLVNYCLYRPLLPPLGQVLTLRVWAAFLSFLTQASP
jgi:hypothetical protein